MDNRVFNVNGVDDERLRMAVQLVCQTEYGNVQTANAWKQTEEHGLILYWHENEASSIPLPASLDVDGMVDLISSWLDGDFAKTVEPARPWCINYGDPDVSCKQGWQLYVEDWGHVDNSPYAIFGVRPAWGWYGK